MPLPVHGLQFLFHRLPGSPHARAEPSNESMVKAAMMIVDEERDGLSSDYGRDADVGLMRELRRAGLPSDKTSGARAFIAAGETLKGLESVRRFALEIEQGRKHRVETRHHRGIVRILEQRAEERSI